MDEIIQILKKIRNEIEKTIEMYNTSKTTDQRKFYDNVFMIPDFGIQLLSVFNSEKLENWKETDKYLFLHFVPALKNFLLLTEEYLKEVIPSLKHFYTNEITDEIQYLNKEISKFEKDLDSYNEDYIIREKDKLEEKYKRLKYLVEEKDKLLKEENALKKFDFEACYSEIEELRKINSELDSRSAPLLKEKSELENKISELKLFEKNISRLILVKDDTYIELLEKIGSALEVIKEKQNNWDKEKDKIISRFEEESKKLKETEEEIKDYIVNISNYRDKYLQNKGILDKHFSTDKKILNSIPNLRAMIEYKTQKLERDLNDLDLEIKKLLEINQNLSDELIKNPLMFEY